MFGEIGVAIGRMYVFGFLTGTLHLLSMWIDYLGYATMHFCQVMVIAFVGAIDFFMLIMSYKDGGPMQAKIMETTLSQTVYWTMLVFSLIKAGACF